MKILTVIPARGGSKGIPGKNIAPLLGRPLLAYTIDAAKRSGAVDELWVSTDSEAIAIVAREQGAKVVMRPAEIAVDTASTESALIHALDYVENKLCTQFDAVLTLQPTSPLRSPESISGFVSCFAERYQDLDAMLTLHRDHSDFWIQKPEGFQRLNPNAPRRRQDRDPLFVENSCMYLSKSEVLRKVHFILGNHYDGYEISALEAIDINEPIDLLLAEAALKYLNNLKTHD